MSRVKLQSSLLRGALRRPTAQPRIARSIPTGTTPAPAGAARTFSHLPTLRPTLLTTTPTTSIFRAPNQQSLLATPPMTTATSTATGEALDLLAKTAVTSHPALAGVASQVRCGPRPTMSGATRLIQKRRHGFLSRIRTKGGRKTLMRRRLKGRSKLAH